MNKFGRYPNAFLRQSSAGVEINLRTFIALNSVALFNEVLPIQAALRGIRIRFDGTFSTVGTEAVSDLKLATKRGSRFFRSDIEVTVREPMNIVENSDMPPIITLWWICYRIVRAYIHQAGILDCAQLLPLNLANRLHLPELTRWVGDSYSEFNFSKVQLCRHIDNNILSNVIIGKLATAWNLGEDPDPITTYGPLLLVTAQNHNKLF